MFILNSELLEACAKHVPTYSDSFNTEYNIKNLCKMQILLLNVFLIVFLHGIEISEFGYRQNLLG